MERPGAFERVKERLKTRWEEAGRDGVSSAYRPSSSVNIDRLKRMDGSKGGSSGGLRTMSVGEAGIYYIYAFDGRLLAEYDGYGACLREYIYIGAKMVAEYQPTTGKYYYYTSDQINSTRVVTDDMGNVVYSGAYDPYGGVQQTWVNTFNPGWKFSGKEQDAESGLYYFGARYYDPALYRFLSPDPVIPSGRAVYNLQRWNLYGYCLGNPINYCDPDGADGMNILILRFYYGPSSTLGLAFVNGEYIGVSLERPWLGRGALFGCMPEGVYRVTHVGYIKQGEEYLPFFKTEYYSYDAEKNRNYFTGILAGNSVEDLHNCIFIGDEFASETMILGTTAIKELEKSFQNALHLMFEALEASLNSDQTNMVLYSFDALDALTDAFHTQINIQINVIVTSIFTIIMSIPFFL